MDLLGSGFSDKPDDFSYSIADHADYLADLVDYLDLAKLIIYGHSMGGAIAIELAERSGDRLQGIILSEANLDPGGGLFSRKIAKYDEREYLISGQAAMVQQSVDEGNRMWAASLAVSSPLATHREAKSLIIGSSPTWRRIFYSLSTEKTYIFGSESLPNPDLQALSAENIAIEIVPEAGHSMAWDNPDGLATAIKNAINRLVY